MSRTTISAAVLAVLLLGACASQPTAPTPAPAAASSVGPAVSPPPISSAAPESVAPSPLPASSGPPDPCLAPIVEKAATVAVPDPDAVSLRVCHPGAIPERAESVVLNQNDANNIGKLLDVAPEATANCETQPDAVLRFGYGDGTEADVEIFAVPQPDETGCDQSTASVAGHLWLLAPTLASFLDADAIAPGAKGNPPPTPNVTGLSLAQATEVTTRAGMTIYSGGRLTDPLLSADTVVLQDPPAGAGMIGSGTEIDVLLSQEPAPTCSAAQLAIDYHGVQYGTGDAFSSLEIRDTGPKPCTLIGPISVVGLDAAGQSVTNREVYPVASDLVLTARAPREADGAATPNDVEIAWVPIQANVRDGPDANGMCTNHLVVPATWLTTLTNGEKLVHNGEGTPGTTMSACEGQLMGPPQTGTQVTAIN
jgi:hypothetical protein